MPMGDPGGHFAASGGYGGNFPGAGGASMGSSPGGPEHGGLGYGLMSPGGYNSGVYAQNYANRYGAGAAGAAKPGWNMPPKAPPPAPGILPPRPPMPQPKPPLTGAMVNQPAPQTGYPPESIYNQYSPTGPGGMFGSYLPGYMGGGPTGGNWSSQAPTTPSGVGGYGGMLSGALGGQPSASGGYGVSGGGFNQGGGRGW